MNRNAVQVKWYGINALEFRHGNGSFMIDPYVSRNREKLTVPEEVDHYLTSKPDFVLMTHSHWDHLPDMPQLIRKTDTVLCASRTACCIMRSLGVPEKNLHELAYGEHLELPGGVRVTALESRHMGDPAGAIFYDAPQDPEHFRLRENWLCGEVFAFLIEIGSMRILNIGSANLHAPAMHGIACDFFFCGISRWKPGFPELITENIRFKSLIPTHHDEFTLPLSDFHLRDDMKRLKEALPTLNAFELPILQWTELGQNRGAELQS